MAADVDPVRHTYYGLRRVLVMALGLSPHEIRPLSRLDELVPGERRREVWKKLRHSGYRLPGLCLPRRIAALAHVGFLLKLAASFVAQQLLAWILFVPLTVATWLIIRPYAIHVDRCGPITLWDAVLYLMPYKGNEQRRWSHREIETKVRLILAETLHIPLEKIHSESRLVEDFGAG